MGTGDYEKLRSTWPIKNYKRVKHKNKPYFKINSLQNVHTSNSKGPFKFAGNEYYNNTPHDDEVSTRTLAGDANTWLSGIYYNTYGNNGYSKWNNTILHIIQSLDIMELAN